MKLIFNLFFLLYCLFWVKSQAFAGGNDPTTSLENLLTSVWQSSASLKGQSIQADLAAGDRYRRFIFNEPVFQYSNTDDNTGRSYGILLPVPFPGKSFAFMQFDSAKAHLARAELFAKKYDLTKTMTQAYLDCAAAQATYEIQQLTSADLETVSQTLKSLYDTGHATLAEKIGSELQFRQSQFDLTSAEDKRNVFCKKLDSLIPVAGEPGPSFVNQKANLPDDIDPKIILELGDKTADENRAIAAADLSLATASTRWWSQVPDLNFSINRNQYLYLPASPSGKEWTTSFSVSLILPIFFPFHESVEAKRIQSQAQIDRNTAELQKVSARSDQIDAAKEYIRSRKRLNDIRIKDLALAEALVESTYSAYRSGKLGYAELVLSRKTLSDIRNQDIQLRVSIINAHLRCLNRCDQTQSKNHPDETSL